MPRKNAKKMFDLNNIHDKKAAKAICLIDKKVTFIKPSYVPSLLNENEFFQNYFTHVASIRKWIGEYI